MIHYVEGDACSPSGPEIIICHVVNTANKIGAGFSADLVRRYRQVKLDYRQSHKPLGLVIWTKADNDTLIASMVAQRGVRSQMNPKPIHYGSLERCLWSVTAEAIIRERTVHMPRIGSGLAGGEWPTIEGIIDRTLVASGVDVFVYTLPASTELARAIVSPSRIGHGQF